MEDDFEPDICVFNTEKESKKRKSPPSDDEDTPPAKKSKTDESENVDIKQYKRRICTYPDCKLGVRRQGFCEKHAEKCIISGCNRGQRSSRGFCRKHDKQCSANGCKKSAR